MARKSDSPSQTCAPGAEKANTACFEAALSQVVQDKTPLMFPSQTPKLPRPVTPVLINLILQLPYNFLNSPINSY